MSDFSTILQCPEIHAIVREQLDHLQKQAMTTQPKIQGFEFYDRRNSEDFSAPRLSLTITVPDGVVAATLLAHITALVQQYQSVQQQVEQSEAQPAAQSVAVESQPESQPTTAETVPTPAPAKTATRKAPAKPKKSPPPRVENIPEPTSTPTPAEVPVHQPLAVTSDPAPAVAEKPADPEPVPAVATTPEAETSTATDEPSGSGETCPPELASASSFRQVIVWMVAHDYKTVDMIVSKCEEYASSCPAIVRATSAGHGGLTERVTRGLDVVMKMGATA